jgi:hypothetical protein
MRKLRTLVFVLSISPVGILGACPNWPENRQLEIAESMYAEAVDGVAALYIEADLIFIGRALEVSEERIRVADLEPETRSMDIGHMVFGEVEIEPIQILKGSLRRTATFTYTRDESRINISCGRLGSIREVHLRPTYRFIFYARGSEILRASLVVDWFEHLNYETELKLILNGS